MEKLEKTDPSDIGNKLCDHFINHPKNIHNSIPPSNTSYQDRIAMNENTMVFHYTTDTEVLECINNMKKTGGLGDVSSRFLVVCGSYVSAYICKLFNLCIDQGVFPKNLKLAKVTPIHKKGSYNMISNYRPISVLSNISKIFECLMHSRINQFFMSQNILSPNQFGYRKGLCTELAIFELLLKVLPAIEHNKFCITVFLDYSACFDTLSREVSVTEKWYCMMGSQLRTP